MTNKTPHQIIAGQSGSNCPCPRCSAGYADAVIAEMEAAGFEIVPKEPTPEMIEASEMVCQIAGFDMDSETMGKIYAAFLAAAPK